MSAKKRKTLPLKEIDELLDLDDSDDCEIESESESGDEFSDGGSFLGSEESDNDDNLIALPSDWARQGIARNPFPFIGDSGVKFIVEDKNNPMEFFEMFFNENIFELIVTETNRFAKQFLDAKLETLPTNSRMRKWFDASINEMKVFIGLLILQGVDSKASNDMYFSSCNSLGSPFLEK